MTFYNYGRMPVKSVAVTIPIKYKKNDILAANVSYLYELIYHFVCLF